MAADISSFVAQGEHLRYSFNSLTQKKGETTPNCMKRTQFPHFHRIFLCIISTLQKSQFNFVSKVTIDVHVCVCMLDAGFTKDFDMEKFDLPKISDKME